MTLTWNQIVFYYSSLLFLRIKYLIEVGWRAEGEVVEVVGAVVVVLGVVSTDGAAPPTSGPSENMGFNILDYTARKFHSRYLQQT